RARCTSRARILRHGNGLPRAVRRVTPGARRLQSEPSVESSHAAMRGHRGGSDMSADGLSAVILAGTHHWSGSSFERLAPRPLVPVALLPLISYPLRWLRTGGLRSVTVCANGTTSAIADVIGDGTGFGLQIDYYQDGTPRGAAGCVRDAGLRTGSDT